ncbi:MAG: efflux RND transporter periplasmic adaptor subunit [Burkholderiaceae bacterium]|nr:efflux RND transporter periplasmic adaptor subunit [Burkholderiaceae bacterium]
MMRVPPCPTALVCGFFALAACHVMAAEPSRGPAAVVAQVPAKNAASNSSATRPAQTGPAAPSLEQREIRAQLAPHRYTTLAAEIGAKISHLPVQEGSAFKAGQTLVSFDCSLQQAQLNKARAALRGAEKTWGGNKRLAELNSVGKVELDVSEAEVLKNQAEVAAMGTMLSKCSIAAPFSGRVAEQKVREQQYVQPGQAILDIIDDSVLEIEFLVPSKWLAWVKPGYAFQVSIDETRKSYPAKVQRIGARVDPVSQSVKLVATISGRFPELITGMSGRVNLVPPGGM